MTHKALLQQAWDALKDRCGTNAAEQTLIAALQAAIDAPEPEPVSAQCKFDSNVTWSGCAVEHHKLVQSEPQNWPDYQTRLLYLHPSAVPVVHLQFKPRQLARDPLSEDQIFDIAHANAQLFDKLAIEYQSHDVIALFRAIEAAARAKE